MQRYGDLQHEVREEMASELDARVAKRFEIDAIIGRGSYGVVWRATERRTREAVALKKCFDAFRSPTDAQRTYREVAYLLSMRGHDNIIALSGVLKAENGQDLYLVFDLMETDLQKAIQAGLLEETHKRYVTFQALRALAYLHSADVVHRDLKPANLLLDDQCRMKLCDFGLARSASEVATGAPDPYPRAEMTDYVATRYYRAPEVLVGSKRYGRAIDLWALGCIVGEMCAGKPLFAGSTTLNQLERIFGVLRVPTEAQAASWNSPFSKSLVENAVHVASPNGSGLQAVLPRADPEAIDLLAGLLQYDPSARLPAYAMDPKLPCGLRHPYCLAFFTSAGGDAAVALSEAKLRAALPDQPKRPTANYREALHAMAAAQQVDASSPSRSSPAARGPNLSQHPPHEHNQQQPPTVGVRRGGR